MPVIYRDVLFFAFGYAFGLNPSNLNQTLEFYVQMLNDNENFMEKSKFDVEKTIIENLLKKNERN